MDYKKLKEEITKIVEKEKSLWTYRREIIINAIMDAVKKCDETKETEETTVPELA